MYRRVGKRSMSRFICAHRGASGSLPGHTLLSYEEAVRQGCDYVELDVHSTRDGELVVTHDVQVRAEEEL